MRNVEVARVVGIADAEAQTRRSDSDIQNPCAGQACRPWWARAHPMGAAHTLAAPRSEQFGP